MKPTDKSLEPFTKHDLIIGGRAEGYMPLELVLLSAYQQASGGKGRDRHAAGDDFIDQPILSIGRLLKSADGEAYQAIKKTREGLQMHRAGKSDAAIREILGAINYLAAVAILISEQASDAVLENVKPEIEEGRKKVPLPVRTPPHLGTMATYDEIQYAVFHFTDPNKMEWFFSAAAVEQGDDWASVSKKIAHFFDTYVRAEYTKLNGAEANLSKYVCCAIDRWRENYDAWSSVTMTVTDIKP